MKLSFEKGPSSKCSFWAPADKYWEHQDLRSWSNVANTWSHRSLAFKLVCPQRNTDFYKTPVVLLHFPCLYYVTRFVIKPVGYLLLTRKWMSVVIFTLNHLIWTLFIKPMLVQFASDCHGIHWFKTSDQFYANEKQ